MPFANLTDYELEKEFETTKNYFLSLMEENCFHTVIKENNFLNKMDGQDSIPCKYYDNDEFISLNLNNHQFLNIFSLNISSLPKHAGELACFLCSLETTFDIIVLCETGKCNITMFENLFPGFTLYYNLPESNIRGGVGIYISNRLGNVVRKTEIEF